MGERTGYTPGTFCWVDLVVEDQDAAKAFYTDLFGWDYEDFPTGEGGDYSIAEVDGRSVASRTPRARSSACGSRAGTSAPAS